MIRRNTHRWFLLSLTLLALMALTGAVFADGPVEGRAGRAEVRFLEGMIDHHQMALDMANHCLANASAEEVKALCGAVIAAQTPEIEQMQGWLRDWYGIDYQPMSMLGISSVVTLSAVPAVEAPAAMCGMMGGEGCAMMDSSGMSGMSGMAMMGEGGMSGMMQGMPGMGMMGGEMTMPMMQMQMMMMQMQIMQMQMMMTQMGMGGMQGMSGMGMMGDGGMQGMNGMGGMQGMGAVPAEPAPDADHSAHHPAAGATTTPDHSQHETAPAAEATAMPETGAMPGMDMGTVTVSDPAMAMGMLAGFDRLSGLDYDLAWLEAMIEHHDGAIHMAERIQPWAQHDELRALADSIIISQGAEIEQIEALIAQLSA